MYNILHVLTGDDGGISAVVRNFYNYIDKEMFHFDLACITENEGNDVAALKAMGASVFHLPMKSLGIQAYMQGLRALLTSKKYDAIHVHESQTSYIALKIAKQLGIKCRIAHAHTSAPYTSIGGEIRRLSGIIFNYHYATTVIGCGKLAGNRVFGKWNMKRRKAVVLPNAIALDKYRYNSDVRMAVRNELALTNQHVVGFVGRIAPQKNPLFCLEVIQKLHKLNKNAVLIMAGDGSEEKQLRAVIQSKHMESYVYLLGKRTDANRLYQAFDALILPSLYEGFPLVAVEALASGIPVFLSNRITHEFSSFAGVHYLSLTNADDWAYLLNNILQSTERSANIEERFLDMFDITYATKKLESIYLSV